MNIMIHKHRRLSYLILFIFMFTMVFSPVQTAYAQDNFTDINGHWAQSTIQAMADAGIISGNPDGSFNPDGTITRAEFAVILVKAFSLTGSGKVFTDTASHWAKDYIASASANGIVSGYTDTIFGADDPVTREQMAVMIVKATKLNLVDSQPSFTDSAKISSWANSAVATASANNIIKGLPDGSFDPQAKATRAQAAVIVNASRNIQVDKPVIAEPEQDLSSINKAGTYGPANGSKTVEGNVTIKAADVVLQNLIIKGDLTIAKEVGDGDVTLNNIKVEGKTYIRGGGKDSIHINGGQYNEVIVEKTATGQVRIIAIDAQGIKIIVAENAKGEEIILEGQFKSVTIKADNVKISTQADTKIDEFKIQSGLVNINIELAKDSTVKEMVLDSKATVKGEGTIKEAKGKEVKDSSFAITPDKITTPSSSGGGGESSSKVAVSAISVSPETMTLAADGAPGTITATVSPSNATNKNITWTTSDANVATVANGVVTPIAVGEATITATTVDGNKTATCTVTVVTPAEVTATKTGEPAYNEERKETYQLYTVEVAVTPADSKVYQIKPDGTISELTILADEDNHLNIWFRLSGGVGLQQEGDHIFLIKKDDTWSKAVINYNAAEDPMVTEALNKVNSAEKFVSDENHPMRVAIEANATVLGLATGEGTTYYGLVDGRKRAVNIDLYDNKPAGGYDLETLQVTFDEIVVTRLVFEQSVDLFTGASAGSPLKDLSYITMLITNLEGVQKQTKHSSRDIKTNLLPELKKLVTDFNALTAEQQTAVLAGIDYTKSSSSTATRNALRAAITEVEAEQAAIDARLAITSVTIADNKAYASTAAGEGTVRVLGYGIGINLNADSSGKKVSGTTSIVIELYKGETLLGQQTFNEAGRTKHAEKSATSGTIDAGGQYKATSWDNSWSAGIAEIPDKAVATVQYSDGTATAEKTLTFTDEETKIFFAAEAVHALFEDVFAETLVLADGVTQDAITAASGLVEAVTLNPTQNKVALQELKNQAQALLDADQADVDAAMVLLPTEAIAQITVSGGEGAEQTIKTAAVKSYLEAIDGMASLVVTIDVAWNETSSNYDVTVSKGEATVGQTTVSVTTYV